MSKKVLVTGGTGFTGSHLVDRLLKRGHNVIALDASNGHSNDIRKNGAKVILGSVCDKELINNIMKDIDVVFHVAAAFRKISDPKKVYWDVNVTGTKILLEAASKNGVEKFIHCSTCGVHGGIEQIPANENAPIKPEDYYQYTKTQGEIVAQEFFKNNKDLPGVILRPAGIYGPRDTRLLTLFKAIKNQKFIMFGSGKILYHLLYIDNLIDAFEISMNKENATGVTYLVADEEYITLNELVTEIARVLNVPTPKKRFPVWPVWFAGLLCEGICKPFGIEPPLFRRRVDFFIKNRGFDISKAKKELGYKPKVGFSEGIKTCFVMDILKFAVFYSVNP